MRPYVILFNNDANIRGGEAIDAIASLGNLDAIEPIEAVLSKLGPVERVDVDGGDPETLALALKKAAPRVVVNLAEAARGVAELEACIAGVLELLGLPYTGSTPQTLALCLDKPKTKALLRGAGLPVPSGVVLRDAARDSLGGVEYPAIVKPACSDASHGIEPSNVVSNERAARAKAAELLGRFPPAVVVERFIDGREINVTVVDLEPGSGPMVLPFAEVDWRVEPGVPRVCGYEAKWVEGTQSFVKTPIICPPTLSPDLERRISEVSIAAFEATGCRDYARIDLRIDADDRPVILEVNPNPCLTPIAGVARSAGVAGWSYDALIERIVRSAEARGSVAPIA